MQIQTHIFESSIDNKMYKIHVINIDNDLWFLVDDIYKALGIEDISELRLTPTDKMLSPIPIISNKEEIIISENGLYSYVIRRTQPKVLEFRRWLAENRSPPVDGTNTSGNKELDKEIKKALQKGKPRE